LQAVAGGYRQFGTELRWDAPDTVTDSHRLIGYIDSALKNYYRKRSAAIEDGVQLTVPQGDAQENAGSRAYILLPQNNLPDSLADEFWYINEALKDDYGYLFPNHVLAGSAGVPVVWRQEAAAAGCRWVVKTEVSAARVKEKKNVYYISISQTVYDVATGVVVDAAIFSTSTDNLTPLEACIHAFKDMNLHVRSRLDTQKEQ